MAARLAERGRDILLAVVELPNKAPVGTGFLQRVQIAALKVLDERDFDTLGLAQVADHRRQFVEASPLRRPPATFAGDDLVGRAAVVARPHHQRLDDALLADRGGQALDLGLVEVLARLIGMGSQVLDGDGEQRPLPRAERARLHGFAEEGGKALAEAALARLTARVGCHAALSFMLRSRRSISPAR